MRPAALLAVLAASCASGPLEEPRPEHVPAGWRLLYEERFDGAAPALTYSDSAAWRIARLEAGGALELFGASKYRPPVRSPRNLALIPGLAFGDFLLEADLLQTGREYGHRDMCVFFGVQARDKMYYLHLATEADDHAHNVFRVDRAPRTKFGSRTTEGVDWGSGVWHHVRVLREAATGRVTVWFDDMEAPIIEGRDMAFDFGQIGFGSFDDTGMVDTVRVWGPAARRVPGLRFE